MTPPPSVRSPPASPTERQAIARLLVAGRTAHPGIALGVAPFEVGALARAGWTAADDGGSREDALLAIDRRGRGADLYLALACDAELPGAWERLCAVMVPAVVRGLSARGLASHDAEAEAADLPGHLIQRPEHGRSSTRLGGYRGASSLATFLTVAAYGRWSTERRRTSLASLDREADDGSRAIEPAASPARETSPEDAEAARRLEDALPIAWARLTARESVALLFKDRDGLSQTTIARLLGVGPPRVSRILDRAYERLREELAGPIGSDRSVRPALGAPVFAAVVARFLATLPPSPRPGRDGPLPAAAAPPHRP